MFYMYITLPKMNAMAFIIKPHLLDDGHSFRCLRCYLKMMEGRVNILKPLTAGEGGWLICGVNILQAVNHLQEYKDGFQLLELKLGSEGSDH